MKQPGAYPLALAAVLQEQPHIDFAVLVGSRATGAERLNSDWDIALAWEPTLDWLDVLGQTETLRTQLANALQVCATEVDLIDLQHTNLAMRAAVAEEGVPVFGDDSVAWAQFLRRTWRELEDFYWERNHAA
jgi:predicted nucleotidyltransferase